MLDYLITNGRYSKSSMVSENNIRPKLTLTDRIRREMDRNKFPFRHVEGIR